jgi:hypothetical protein
MTALVVRAGSQPAFAALPALLLVAVCIAWQGRYTTPPDREWSPDEVGGTTSVLRQDRPYTLASVPTAGSQFAAIRPASVVESEDDADASTRSAAPAAGVRHASFAERFAAAFYEEEDAPGAVEVEATPGDRDDMAAIELGADDEARFEGRTAVYDIARHTVYLPNGEKLEAHSGLGRNLDNPRFVTAKNRGPTPPNIYNLVLRKGRFHGVQAIRLVPVDERKMFGRDGMLAHTYMLGSSGQSNGCVVFRNYPSFLSAFTRGEVRRLVVVDRLAEPPDSGSVASLDAIVKRLTAGRIIRSAERVAASSD